MNATIRSMPGLLAAGLIVALATGCSTLHDPSDTVLPPDTPALEDPRLKWHIGVLPIVITDEFRESAAATNNESSHRRWDYVPDTEWQRTTMEEIVQAMRDIGCAERVVFLPGAESRRLDSVLSDAWEDQLDLVIRPVLTRRSAAISARTTRTCWP